jgi:uncharacterized membrane protein
MAKSDTAKLQVVLLWVIWIVGLVWILAEGSFKKDKFIKFWLKQWLSLVLVGIIVWFAGMFLTVLTLGIFGIIMIIVWILFFILWLLGLIWIIQEKTKPLPIVGKLGESIFKF